MSQQAPAATITVEGEMTIYTAADWREKLLAATQGCQALEIDLGKVSEIDSSGLQLLIAAHKEMTAHGGALRLTHHSKAVRELLEFCRMERYFGDPVLIPADA